MIPNPFLDGIKKILDKNNKIFQALDDKFAALTSTKDIKTEVLDNKIIFYVRTAADKQRIEKIIESIKNSLNQLDINIQSIQKLLNAINVLKQTLEIQEIVLKLNPLTVIIEQFVTLLFSKDIIATDFNILSKSLNDILPKFENYIEKFRNLNVELLTESEPTNTLNSLNPLNLASNLDNQILENLANPSVGLFALVGQNVIPTLPIVENFLYEGNTYKLEISKYGQKQLIGKAYLLPYNNLAAETAPSYFKTPTALLAELKTIITV